MADHQFTAFQWSGTGYNATYNTSVDAVISDDDNAYEGSGDSDELISIDGAAPVQSTSQPYSIDISFTDVNGDSHVETFQFFNAGGAWYFAPGEDSAFSEGATLGSYQGHTVGWDYDSVVCFVSGTLIRTDRGERPIETLCPGDLVLTLDNGLQPLRRNMTSDVAVQDLQANPKLRPVTIMAGALGPGLPARDLRVSRQHRMLVSSRIAQRMFGTEEVLLPAVQLTDWPGCFIDDATTPVRYHHLVFDHHEVIFANRTPSESFFPGPEALKSLAPAERAEFLMLFPNVEDEVGNPIHARMVPKARLQKKLLSRHQRNNRPLIVRTSERRAPRPTPKPPMGIHAIP